MLWRDGDLKERDEFAMLEEESIQCGMQKLSNFAGCRLATDLE